MSSPLVALLVRAALLVPPAQPPSAASAPPPTAPASAAAPAAKKEAPARPPPAPKWGGTVASPDRQPDLTVAVTLDPGGPTDDGALLQQARQRALEQLLQAKLGPTLVAENRERLWQGLGPLPTRYVLPLSARRVTRLDRTGLELDEFVAGFAVAREFDAALGPLAEEVRALPRPRLLLLRMGAAAKTSAEGGADAWAELASRLQGKLAPQGWRFVGQEELAARLGSKAAGHIEFETLRAAGLVGPGDVVVQGTSTSRLERTPVAGLFQVQTVLSWRALEAASGDLLAADTRTLLTPSVTESGDRGLDAAAQAFAADVQGRVLSTWRSHQRPTGAVVVVVTGIEYGTLVALREVVGTATGAPIGEVTFGEGAGQVKLLTPFSADRIAEKLLGKAVGSQSIRIERLSAGRVEIRLK